MAVQTHVTVEDFEKIAALPENTQKRLEFIGGEVVEVFSTNFTSMIGATVAVAIVSHVKQNVLGYVTGANDGYMVSGERYIPNAAFISKVRQPKPSHDDWNPQAPDLAVEVVSPSDNAAEIADKVANYLLAGTLVWYVYPERQQVKVYESGKPVKILRKDVLLDGGTVLPGFNLALSEIFASE